MTALEIALAGYLAFGQPTGNYYEAITKHAGLQVIHSDGTVTLRLEETGREETAEGGSKTVTIRMKDERYSFEVTRYVRTWDDCAAVETWAEIRHEERGTVKLLRADSFAAPVAVKSGTVRVMSLTGIAKNEANVSETALANGQTLELVSSAGTRNAWEANAAMMVEFGDGVDEERGKVLGVALEWAGTSCRRVRRNWDGKITEVFAGVDMTTGPYTLDPGVTFTTPRAILVWSEKGRGEVSREFHRWAHRHLMPHGYDLHPVLLNSWEGSYFSFTEQTLLDMMDGVKEMGGEMFVLDDGWFGRGKHARDEVNKATAGLGDWCVNTNKLPHGLGWLADEAAKRGLQFGLWIEPEMANTNSWLYQEHPDWVLQEAGRPLVCGRGKTQVTLDFCNPAVRDNLFGQLDAVYDAIPSLAYVKWDCNANIWNPGSPYLAADRQPNLWYDYAMGYSELMARFQAKRPQVMVQACASGGGRMDFGSLRYADEFWASDCTDPYRRIFIQWGASQFYPASAMACHVTASPNHQTKRVTPLKYRFDVAMTGRLGFELHPKDMTADEIAFAKAAVADYKRIRPVVQRGDLYRLVSPYEKPLSALMYVGEGRDAAVVFALGLKDFGKHTETLKLRGLDPEATYSIKEINCGERLHLEGGSQSSATVSGRDLMERGLAVMLSGDYDSAVFEISRQEAVAGLAVGCCSVVKPDHDTLIAHRGESVDAPENTLPAYKTAVERGFGFECDIYLSKDGRVFTFHDKNLKRVTDGANTNRCGDMAWADLERVDVGNWGKWKDSRFKGTRPALLEEVLELARDGRRIYIEVKTGPEIVPHVKRVFERQTNATPGNVLFIAFNRDTCKVLKAEMPEYKVYLLTYATTYWGKDAPPITAQFLLDGLKETGADGVDCMYKPETVTAQLVKAVRDAGYEFHVWTVDNLDDTLEAFRRGVQTVTTNCAKRQLDEYKSELRPVRFWQEDGNSENCVHVVDAKPPATNGAFRVMSYNIQMSYGIDGKLDPARTAKRILSESPDFVCVNEVWNAARFKQLTDLLGMHGAFTHRDGCVGNAVYSHVKPLKVEAFELPSSKYKRTLLICEFKDFAVASMHLDLEERKRLESVPVVRKALARYKKPVFIAGDWNNWPNTRVLKGLKEFVTVISPEHGIHTFHKWTLNRKECVIDYIAVDKAHAGDFSIMGAWEVPDRMTSDHSPIVVELRSGIK